LARENRLNFVAVVAEFNRLGLKPRGEGPLGTVLHSVGDGKTL
jgi:hypothetical protein